VIREPGTPWLASALANAWGKHLLVTPHGRVVYPLLQSALEVRNGFGAAPKPHLLAEIISSSPADAALPTRDADL
jgi:hypothetical protein